MNRSVNESRLRQLVSASTGVDVSRLDSDHDLVDALNLDSLGGLELLAYVEQQFDVFFDDRHLAAPATLACILDAIDDASGRDARRGLHPATHALLGAIPQAGVGGSPRGTVHQPSLRPA